MFPGFLQVITIIGGCKHLTREIKTRGGKGRGTRKIKGRAIKIDTALLPNSWERE